MKKWLLLVIYVLILLIGFFNINHIMPWIRKEDSTLLPYMFPLAVFLGVFPVIPYGLFAGMMGAKFGPIWGLCINWTGGVCSTILMFLYIRYGYQKSGREFLARFPQVNRFTGVFEKNALLALLFARFIPIVPSPIVTIYAAISSVSAVIFALSTAIGKIPSLLMYSIVGNQVFTNIPKTCITLLFYGSFVGIAYFVFRKWQARHAKKTLP